MKTRIIRSLFALLKMISINALRASLIILAYLLYFTAGIAQYGQQVTARLAEMVDVHIDLEVKDQFDQKFDINDIERMAKDLPEKIKTIEGIASYYDVSYRQARKVRGKIGTTLSINRHQRTVSA